MNQQKIGEFKVERDAKQNLLCRQIVHEIMNFGVNDRMILKIIATLAMNIENVEHMKAITHFLQNLKDADITLINRIEDDERVDYVSNNESLLFDINE